MTSTATTSRPGRRRVAHLGAGVRSVVLAAWSLLSVGPLVWMIYASLKSDRALARNMFSPPSSPRFDHWANVLFGTSIFPVPMGVYVLNTLVAAVPAVVGAVGLGALGAYGIVRFRPRGGGVLQAFVVFVLPLPVFAVLVPVYVYMHALGLTNTRAGLSLTWLAFNLSFAFMLMRAFLSRLPVPAIEAGLIDGCSEWQAFVRIVLPLAKGPLTAAAVLIFIGLWGEFPMAVVMIQRQSLMTIQPAVAVLAGVGPTGSVSAELSALAMTTAVPVIVYLVMHRRIFAALGGSWEEA